MKVANKYASFFTFESKEKEIEHDAGILSARFMSEVERVCEKKGISRADLAQRVGTSKSYITQLFRGDKTPNMELLAKFQKELSISFFIKAKHNPTAKYHTHLN